jgi:hypothetical protein
LTCHGGDPDLEKYDSAARAALKKILGESGAKAILYYTGEPRPDTFDAKLRSILGNGATIVLVEIKRQSEADGSSPKRHWLGGRS